MKYSSNLPQTLFGLCSIVKYRASDHINPPSQLATMTEMIATAERSDISDNVAISHFENPVKRVGGQLHRRRLCSRWCLRGLDA